MSWPYRWGCMDHDNWCNSHDRHNRTDSRWQPGMPWSPPTSAAWTSSAPCSSHITVMVSIIEGRRSLVLGVLTGCASGCVVECGGFAMGIRLQVRISLGLGYLASRSTQPSIPPGSANEYQLMLGRQRQVWLIPIADERVGVQVKLLRFLENTCHTRALLRWWFTTKRRYIKCVHLYLYAPLIPWKYEGVVRVCFDPLNCHILSFKTVVR